MQKILSIPVSLIMIAMLSASLIWLSNSRYIPFDMYEIEGDFYLKKVDYFSHYQLLKVENSNYMVISNDVKKMYQTQTNWIVETENSLVEIDGAKNLHRLVKDIHVSAKSLTPWKLVEANSNGDKIRIFRLLIQAILILFIVNIALKAVPNLENTKPQC